MVIPFGLLNVPVSCLSTINNILEEFLYGEVVPYIDGILIYSKNIPEHALLVSKGMNRWMENSLVADVENSVSEVKKITFLAR